MIPRDTRLHFRALIFDLSKMKVVFPGETALFRRQLKTLHVSIILLSPRANAKFNPLSQQWRRQTSGDLEKLAKFFRAGSDPLNSCLKFEFWFVILITWILIAAQM